MNYGTIEQQERKRVSSLEDREPMSVLAMVIIIIFVLFLFVGIAILPAEMQSGFHLMLKS